MQSKNKKAMSASERAHVALIKDMACVLCDATAPSEAHEIKQGSWFLSVPLCPDCHRGQNGWHGTKAYWRIKKMDELDALAIAIKRIMEKKHVNAF